MPYQDNSAENSRQSIAAIHSLIPHRILSLLASIWIRCNVQAMTPTTLLLHGDCLEMLPTLPDSSVDSIVTDPPYGLSFMGKKWDYDVPSVEIWAECLRVLKPGGHLLAFAGTRTQHRMAVRIEDAGFEIRDMIAWIYGSGFPKSLDVSKAIDKAAGAEREVIGFDAEKAKQQTRAVGTAAYGDYAGNAGDITAPATEAARQWAGWGTALKPALEPITVARKPLVGTVAANVLAHGTGALNIDGCRVERDADDISGWSESGSKASENRAMSGGNYARSATPDAAGRWPANLIHDGSDEVVGLFPDSKTTRIEKPSDCRTDGDTSFDCMRGNRPARGHDDAGGSAARFFYCAKASKRDRGESNNHPTVKPTALMRYLCRLVTPVGGTVLDPFMGSGSTGKAAMKERFNFIGIERDESYLQIASARIEQAKLSLPLL